MILRLRQQLGALTRMVPGLIASTSVVMLMQLQTWEPIERMVHNQVVRWRGARSWDERIVMVNIDDKTLEALGQFPISRDYYAQLVNRLRKEDASVVAFNLILSDSTTAADLQRQDGSAAASARSATSEMAREMAQHGRVVIGQTWDVNGGVIAPVPVFANTAIATGHMRLPVDLDGFTRLVELTYNNFPALGVAAIQAYSLEDELVSIPTDVSQMRLNWPSSVTDLTTLSLVDVLKGVSPENTFKGKIVIVGYGATSGMSPMRTPFDNQWPVPGGYMHAAVVDNLLNQNWLRSVPQTTVMLALMLAGPALSWLLYRRRALIQVGVTGACSLGWLVICVGALHVSWLLPVVSPLATLMGAGLSLFVWGRLQSNALLQVRSAFLSTMSHEIRTPLNAIINLSEMLRDTELDDRQREYAETLHNSSQTLMALINDVLDFSKIESGRLTLEDYPTSLAETIERSIELLAPRAAEKGLEIAYAIDASAPAMIVSDPVRLQQILMNLLSNAVKFTEAGEVSIRVSARPIHTKRSLLLTSFNPANLNPSNQGLSDRTNNKTSHNKTNTKTNSRLNNRLTNGQFNRHSDQRTYQNAQLKQPRLSYSDSLYSTPDQRTSSSQNLYRLPFAESALNSAHLHPDEFYEMLFEVRDTGIGIPSDRMAKLFEPFSQVSASTTRKYGGTGLGLSISKRLSERMGGDLWVKSTVGKGSTFYFTFHTKAANVKENLPDYLSALKGTHLLLIDASKTRCEQIIRELQLLDISTVRAVSIAEAVMFMRNAPTFDGVILDDAIARRFGDTKAAIDQLRKSMNNPQFPLVLLSQLNSDLPNHFPELAADITILWKPIKQSALYQALRSIKPFTLAAASDVPSLPAVSNSVSKAQKQSLKVLIAEDNRINQKVALRLLELLGYQADVVSSGEAVLAALERQRYDVVLMDMRMPDMDGIETTQKIRQGLRQSDIWIVAMTANSMAKDRKRCFAAGMNDYLRKPIKRDALDQALQRAIADLHERQLPG